MPLSAPLYLSQHPLYIPLHLYQSLHLSVPFMPVNTLVHPATPLCFSTPICVPLHLSLYPCMSLSLPLNVSLSPYQGFISRLPTTTNQIIGTYLIMPSVWMKQLTLNKPTKIGLYICHVGRVLLGLRSFKILYLPIVRSGMPWIPWQILCLQPSLWDVMMTHATNVCITNDVSKKRYIRVFSCL